jgi:hypothetical protein
MSRTVRVTVESPRWALFFAAEPPPAFRFFAAASPDEVVVEAVAACRPDPRAAAAREAPPERVRGEEAWRGAFRVAARRRAA